MNLTFADVLLALPVDQTLRGFLSKNGMPAPQDEYGNNCAQNPQELIDRISSWLDESAREELISRLMKTVQLSDEAGTRALFQAATCNIDALIGVATCQNSVHRSFWLATRYPDLFEQACETRYLEQHVALAQQHDLGICRRPDTGDAALAELRSSISFFIRKSSAVESAAWPMS